MSMQATVQIRYVNPPKPGGKLGNVKDTGNHAFFMEPQYLKYFEVNEQCAITYENQTWGKGTPSEKVVNIAVAKNGTTLADLAANQSSPPVQAHPVASPAPGQSHSAWDAERQKAKEIFATGTLQQAIAAGTIKDPNEIEGWLGYIVDAWEVVMQNKRPRDTMNSGSPAGQTYPGMDDGPPPGDPRFRDPLG